MEKEGSWDLRWHSAAKLPPESKSGSALAHDLPQCFLNLNWKQPMTHDAEFESPLSLLVSLPSSNAPAAANGDDGGLIGRFGSICDSGEVSPSCRHCNTNTSRCTTPLNSTPKLNLSAMNHRQQGGEGIPMPANPMPGAHFMPFPAEPGLADGAARLSCFGGRSSGGFAGQFGLPETGNSSMASSSHSGIGSRMGVPENGHEFGMLAAAQLEMEMRSKFGGSSTPEESELRNGQEESSLSDRVTAEASSLRGISDRDAGKRKAAAKRKGKEAPLSSSATNPSTNITEEEKSDAKRCKPAVKTKTEQNCGNDSDAKPSEPPKDYIHVRARRGQATDAHSLAERVRREKISKRMKFLQDLVPSCSRVTGKAVMLDEIINYVQSLQRQVEFLSMKLATLNPRLDHNMENLLSKDLYQACGPMPQPVYPAETMGTVLSYAHQPQTATLLEAQFLNPLESSTGQSQSMQLAHTDATTELGDFWEDDLHSFAQIGFGQNVQGK